MLSHVPMRASEAQGRNRKRGGEQHGGEQRGDDHDRR